MTHTTSGAGSASPSGASEFTPGFSEVRFTQFFIFGAVFVDHSYFPSGHCIFCPSSIYGC
jgi:hypothetical protein